MIIQPGGAESLGFILPLVKIDEEKRLVFARAAQEVPDRSGEIMDYDTAKPAFREWSEGIARASGGLSKGNVRAMHNPRIAAGKIVDLTFSDPDKAVDVCMKIVDDAEWKKCLEGVYTGVSIGGGYAKKWPDPANLAKTRYTPRIGEMSLVDLPCIPTANFAELVKIGGVCERLPLVGRAHTFGELWAARPKPAPTFAELWARKGA